MSQTMLMCFRLFGQAEGALNTAIEDFAAARRDTDFRELGRTIRHMRRASDLNSEVRTLLLSLKDKSGQFGQELLTQVHTQRTAIYNLQEAIPAYLNGIKVRPLAERIQKVIATSPRGLTCEEIVDALRAEEVAIAEQRADWRIAMGAPSAWIIPDCPPSAEVVHKLLRSSKDVRRGFLSRRYSKALAA